MSFITKEITSKIIPAAKIGGAALFSGVVEGLGTLALFKVIKKVKAKHNEKKGEPDKEVKTDYEEVISEELEEIENS